MKRFLAFLVVAALMLMDGSAAFVQAQETTCKLNVNIVSDVDGVPLRGVKCTLIHIPSASNMTLITNSAGIATFRGLKPGGPYQVKATMSGYETYIRDVAFLNLAQIHTLNVRLKLANQEP